MSGGVLPVYSDKFFSSQGNENLIWLNPFRPGAIRDVYMTFMGL